MESLHLMISMTTFILCLILSTFTTTTAATATANDFIRASCNDTSYPSLCYNTLSPYASYINNDTALLADTAISISLKKSKAAAAYVTRLNKTSTPETKDLAPVLDDCVSTLMVAAELARDSEKQMKEIVSVNVNVNSGVKDYEYVTFKVGDVQTWMSAALSNQVTCMDGFEKAADGSVKANVLKTLEASKMVTSNALALIIKYHVRK